MTYSSYFPMIERTLRQAAIHPGSTDQTFLNFGKCLCTDQIDVLICNLKTFFTSKFRCDSQTALQKLEETCAAHECSLQNILTFIAEQAVLSDQGEQLLDVFDQIATESSHSMMIFLCAWLALNLDDPELCVHYCKQVKYAFSPTLSIQGQALLELFQAEEAIACLEQAVDIAPKDLISWFFLSKAYYAVGDELNAWLAADTCLRIEPHHPEILALVGMMACQAQDSPNEWIERAWAALFLYCKDHNSGMMVAMLYVIAFKLEDRQKAHKLNQCINLEAVKEDQDFLRNLGHILKLFKNFNWQTENQDFLERIA